MARALQLLTQHFRPDAVAPHGPSLALKGGGLAGTLSSWLGRGYYGRGYGLGESLSVCARERGASANKVPFLIAPVLRERFGVFQSGAAFSHGTFAPRGHAALRTRGLSLTCTRTF